MRGFVGDVDLKGVYRLIVIKVDIYAVLLS
jgi:hypothetical protein